MPGFIKGSTQLKSDNYITFFIGHVMTFHLDMQLDPEFKEVYLRAVEEESRLRLKTHDRI